MKKELITPRQSTFSWSFWSGTSSISGPAKTLKEAMDEIMKWVAFALDHDEEIKEASITFMEFDAWYKGEPSPKPYEQKIWTLDN